ncbi:hypothetical protein [Altererythrobacter sp. MF3-039]|uniref:hypothetical protein n=1 Tax=Altererythrobacter sp. MF3-039 TaxID=3252901 RepID=UPI00390C937F
MTGSVAIIGGGQIGYAAASAFASEGWDVTLHARSMPDWHDASLAHFRPYLLGEDTAPAADVIVDTIAYDGEDIDRYDPDRVDRLIVISSASVYCDDKGRTLDEAAQNGFPQFDGPITEDQSTVAPGPDTYSTRKIRMEQRASELFGDRATILRPCAIHGPWSRHPREWWFVKRMIDGRRRIPLALEGKSQFQTTAARMIGAFSAFAARHAQGGVFNLGDADSPSVLEIGEAIAHHMGVEAEFVGLSRDADPFLGRTPWSVPAPFVISSKKALATGFVEDDAYIMRPEANDWLVAHNPSNWRAAFPQLAAYPWDLFGYAAEDAALGELG